MILNWLINHGLWSQRKSLRDVSFVKAKYKKIGPRYYVNSTLRSGKEIEMSSDFYVDFDNAATELVMNFTSGLLSYSFVILS